MFLVVFIIAISKPFWVSACLCEGMLCHVRIVVQDFVVSSSLQT
jgi:hypothetical protein